jgi:propionyl-CoA carboxylase alpha chain
MVTGLDLVELMIRIAAGEKLKLKQSDIKLKGWALEARVYAEDPFRNFLPSIGRLVRYRQPATHDGKVRVDSGVAEGGEISMYYDPMIAKLVSYGKDRNEAIAAMLNALDEYYIRGLNHNIPFLAALVDHPRFRAGKLTTNFIAEEFKQGFTAADLPPHDPQMLAAVAAVIHRGYAARDAQVSGKVRPELVPFGAQWAVLLNRQKFDARIEPQGGKPEGSAFHVEVDGKGFEVATDWALGDPLFRARVDGKAICVQVDRLGVSYRLTYGGGQAEALVLSPRQAELAALMPVKAAPDTSKFLLSPMPGLLVSLAVESGQEVKAGEALAVVEAMKMENVLKATRDGVIGTVHAKPGESLRVDQKILEFA